jgi:hypothetical protein
MNRGLSLRPCGRPGPKPGDLGWMTARSSTGFWMCGSPAADGAIGLAHMAPIRRPDGGFRNSRRRESGERSRQPFRTGGRWGGGRWRRWPSIPRGWRRKRGEGVGIDGHKRRKGTKMRVWVNEDGLPLRVVVGPGDEHDGRRLEEVLGGLRVKRKGRGRARTRPMMRRRFGRGCGGGGFEPAFRGIRGGGSEPEGESGLRSIGRPIGGLEAAWSGSSGGGKGGSEGGPFGMKGGLPPSWPSSSSQAA